MSIVNTVFAVKIQTLVIGSVKCIKLQASRCYCILYNNTCSFCIFIGRELCVIKVHTHGWRQLMAWSNLANLFRGSSHDFCQLYYNIKQIDFIFLCFCTVIDHRWRHSVWRTKSHALDCVSCVLFCSSHAMTSSVIYYSTDARKNEIYLLIRYLLGVSE